MHQFVSIFVPNGSWIDLREQYDVRLEQGLDSFVVIDGLPVVTEEQKPKLLKFLLKKLNSAGKTKEEAIFMPLNESGVSEGYICDVPRFQRWYSRL